MGDTFNGCKGDHVDIYHDPIAQRHADEPATLIEPLTVTGTWNGDNLERWLVKFDSDTTERFERVVRIPPKAPRPIKRELA